MVPAKEITTDLAGFRVQPREQHPSVIAAVVAADILPALPVTHAANAGSFSEIF